MKIEINLSDYHANLLKKISKYTEIDVNNICRGMIENFIEEFDSDMCEFIESRLPDDYQY